MGADAADLFDVLIVIAVVCFVVCGITALYERFMNYRAKVEAPRIEAHIPPRERYLLGDCWYDKAGLTRRREMADRRNHEG